MFYFFQRGTEYIRCEIRPIQGSTGGEIIISEHEQAERIEKYPTWEAAHGRWQEIKSRFDDEGWKGPLGRE